jgi:tripartite-type tricarboxylate transporter receptor subunit TctC
VPYDIPMTFRAACGWALLAVAVVLPHPAAGQDYPVRPIRLVVPYTPGTGIDIIARTVGPRLADRWHQSVVVENRPGASGNIGADIVAKAQPDGYTLMMTVNSFTITPALYPKLPYDPVKDFATVGRVATGNIALVVNPAVLPVRTLDELTAQVRARPGKVSYASPGNGTPQHLAVELLKQRLGIELLHVPHKGAAGALTDLLGGQVHLMVLPVHTALPFAKAGKLTVIAVSGEGRSVLAPDSPSFAELGLKNLDIDLYFWVAAPSGAPARVIDKWNRESAAVLALADVRESLLKQGLVPSPSSPEEIAARIKADVARWKKFVSEAKITAD